MLIWSPTVVFSTLVKTW